ncbi:Response regulator receiver domain-containing protein [Glycomyces sambucus]|uniref:Response regulator receiver domain-containing protein n=1 Tax=Glycomyces sambucus TaxID=380244 RepID=A0A1G9MLB3_9ACTN|nr:response regulator [Glycomyces sambucus]SDL75060.1 Response regulator receiver domain-containing protein [Glycomyces sambucus]
MSEAIWIELIKVLPAFLWIGFGFIALAVAKRVFTQQAPRMTKVETPWVTVELAQQAIEAATVRGPDPLEPRPWEVPAPFRADGFPVGPAPELRPAPFGAGYGFPEQRPATEPYGAPGGAGAVSPPPEDDADEDPPVQTEPARPHPPNTPPADEPGDAHGTPLGNGPNQNGDSPTGPLTEPRHPVPEIPPYQFAPPPATTYYAQPLPARTAAYRGAAPPPPYQQPYQRGLRAATRLALSAGALEGGAILWVDDHPEHNALLARVFESVGIRVDLALSTEAAMTALGERPYDLVISDIGRATEPAGPKAGLALLDRINGSGLTVPVVVYAYSRAATTSHPRAAAVTDSPEEVVDLVVDYIGNRDRSVHSGSGWLGRITGSAA